MNETGLNISPRINQRVIERFFNRAIIALAKERTTTANAAQAQIVISAIVSRSRGLLLLSTVQHAHELAVVGRAADSAGDPCRAAAVQIRPPLCKRKNEIARLSSRAVLAAAS
jgi:hypothetical protein